MGSNPLKIEVKPGPRPNSWLLDFDSTLLHPQQWQGLHSEVTLIEIKRHGKQTLAYVDPTRQVEAMAHIMIEMGDRSLYSKDEALQQLILLATQSIDSFEA